MIRILRIVLMAITLMRIIAIIILIITVIKNDGSSNSNNSKWRCDYLSQSSVFFLFLGQCPVYCLHILFLGWGGGGVGGRGAGWWWPSEKKMMKMKMIHVDDTCKMCLPDRYFTSQLKGLLATAYSRSFLLSLRTNWPSFSINVINSLSIVVVFSYHFRDLNLILFNFWLISQFERSFIFNSWSV